MRHDERHVSRRDAADAAGLGERDGADAGQFLARLVSHVPNRGIVEPVGDPLLGLSLLPGDLLLLPGDIAFVFQIVCDL
jgi:hypothetical protein